MHYTCQYFVILLFLFYHYIDKHYLDSSNDTMTSNNDLPLFLMQYQLVTFGKLKLFFFYAVLFSKGLELLNTKSYLKKKLLF